MTYKRAYYAHAIKDDRFIYVIGGRGDSNLVEFNEFVKS